MSLRRSFALLLLVATSAAYAQRTHRGPDSPGTGDTSDRTAPWKFLEKGVAPVKTPVILYWLPADEKETVDSPMFTSGALFESSGRCVSMVIVLPQDSAMTAKLGATGKAPVAVLTDAQGNVTRSVPNVKGKLSVGAVEHAVSDELHARDEAMYRAMSEARRLAPTDKTTAIALYRRVWDDRCLFPTVADEAQHALKELGVIVAEPPSTLAPDPNLKVVPPKTSH